MGIAMTLEQYLDGQGICFDTKTHERTDRAEQAAIASKVDVDSMAKAVVLSTRNGHLVAIVPASRRLELGEVGRCIGQPVALAVETDLARLFPDCEAGAIPPIGAAYGLRTVVDDRLEERQDVYFEAGDHCTLIHVNGKEFHRLMRTVSHGQICASRRSAPSGTIYFGA